MLAPLDIFKKQDGAYVWKAATDSFELAKSKAEELGPGTYMIFSQTTGNKTVITLDHPAEERRKEL